MDERCDRGYGMNAFICPAAPRPVDFGQGNRIRFRHAATGTEGLEQDTLNRLDVL